MSIILEGPDCAGKSTMAKDIADFYGLDIIKSHMRGSKTLSAYRERLACHDVILDRCWISDMIYSKYFGQTPIVDEFEDRMLRTVCARRNIPIIVMLPPLEVIKRRMSARGDEHYDVIAPNIDDIYRDYEDYCKSHGDVTVVRDYDPKGLMSCMFSEKRM